MESTVQLEFLYLSDVFQIWQYVNKVDWYNWTLMLIHASSEMYYYDFSSLMWFILMIKITRSELLKPWMYLRSLATSLSNTLCYISKTTEFIFEKNANFGLIHGLQNLTSKRQFGRLSERKVCVWKVDGALSQLKKKNLLKWNIRDIENEIWFFRKSYIL